MSPTNGDGVNISGPIVVGDDEHAKKAASFLLRVPAFRPTAKYLGYLGDTFPNFKFSLVPLENSGGKLLVRLQKSVGKRSRLGSGIRDDPWDSWKVAYTNLEVTKPVWMMVYPCIIHVVLGIEDRIQMRIRIPGCPWNWVALTNFGPLQRCFFKVALPPTSEDLFIRPTILISICIMNHFARSIYGSVDDVAK